jgi:hypothetical protein
LTSYGSPSYYAQVMFASCLSDYTVNPAATGGGDRGHIGDAMPPQTIQALEVNLK